MRAIVVAMATRNKDKMAERCSVLCQHPGCWDTSTKVYKNNAGHYSRYLKYMDYLLAKKKDTSTKILKQHGSENGLPYLTVSELIPSDLSSPPSSSRSYRRPVTQSVPLERRRESTNTAGSMRFSLSSPLQGNRRQHSSLSQDYSEYWFTPTLVWQPSKRSKKINKSQEKKQDRVLKTTNLTDVLPPVSLVGSHSLIKDRRPLSKTKTKRSKKFKLSMDQYIMEGLSDMPPDIVDQILQEIHSHRYTDECDDIHGDFLVDNDQLLPSLASPPRFPSPLTFGQSRSGNANVPSSMIVDLQSKKIHSSSDREQKRRGANGLSSYSRALAQQPQKALIRLKIRTAQLQAEDEHYYLTTRPSIDTSSKSTGSNTGFLKPFHDRTSPVKTGPSYFTPRSLNKATLQRLNCSKGAVSLSHSKTLGLAVSNIPMKSINEIPIRPSVHIPLLPLHESPFSEEFGSHPDSCTWPDSRSAVFSENASSHLSSDHLIVSADLANQGLLLMNRAGEVVHKVKETDAVKTPKNEKIHHLDVDLGSSTTSPSETTPNSDPTLGSVAPPPTAIYSTSDEEQSRNAT